MTQKVGTLADRIANRLVRAFPGPRVAVAPAQPIVSFTFDDAPKSAWRLGAAILEAAGGRGTYYLSGGLIRAGRPELELMPPEGCADLAARGHELGCHTWNHPKLSTLSRRALAADLDRNAEFLAALDGRTARRNFAVPFAMATPLKQPLLRARCRTSRGGRPGINRGPTDLHYLSAVELRESFLDASGIGAWLDDLARAPGWLIFFTHHIAENPAGGFGVTPGRFEAVVDNVARRGFQMLSVDAALDRLGIEAG